MNTKKCPCCNKEKEKSEYHKNKSKKDGLASLCKICKNREGLAYNKTESCKQAHKKYEKKSKSIKKIYRKIYSKTRVRQYKTSYVVELTKHRLNNINLKFDTDFIRKFFENNDFIFQLAIENLNLKRLKIELQNKKGAYGYYKTVKSDSEKLEKLYSKILMKNIIHAHTTRK